MAYAFNENKTKAVVNPTPDFSSSTALINSTTYIMSASQTYVDHVFNDDCWVNILCSGSSGSKTLNMLVFYSENDTQQIDQLITDGTDMRSGFFPVKAGTKMRLTRDNSTVSYNATVNEWV